jgi:deazaflavin-dependent oxidoreductase (nitroreductase family)
MRSGFAQRHIAPHLAGLQLWLYRRTGNRFQISALLVPSLILVTRGARTGLRRETPLMCWPQGDGTFFVAGTNWGRPNHPAWTANLIADPEAEIVYRRQHQHAKAHLLDADERIVTWSVLEAQWPRYRDYERVSGRSVRIFRLSPVD